MGLNLNQLRPWLDSRLSRKRLRLLTAAGGSGVMLGAAIGAAWLGGTLTRDAQLRTQAESLMTASDHSYAAEHFRKLNGEGRKADFDDIDRRAIALVMRHESYTSPVEAMRLRQDNQRSSLFAALMRPARERQAAAGDTPVLRAGLDLGLMKHNPFSKSAPASPFQLKNKSASDLDCLTQAVYYEARGETDAGQRAVAQVILNRVRHPSYPKTICNVVYQGAVKRTGCQFSFTCNGIMSNRVESWAWKRARAVAEDALDGYVMKGVGSSTHFHVLSVSPGWANRMSRTATIGNHAFYQFRRGGTLTDEKVQPSEAPILARAEAEETVLAARTPEKPVVKPVVDTALSNALNHVKDTPATKVMALEHKIKGDEAHAVVQTLKKTPAVKPVVSPAAAPTSAAPPKP